ERIRDLPAQVGDEGHLDPLDAAVRPRSLEVDPVGEMAVDAHPEDLRAELAEAVGGPVVRDDLGRADEGEVEGIEEQDGPFALEAGRVHADELALRARLRLERRKRLADDTVHGNDSVSL